MFLYNYLYYYITTPTTIA